MLQEVKAVLVFLLICLMATAHGASAFRGSVKESDDICDRTNLSEAKPDAYTGATEYKGRTLKEPEADNAKEHYEAGRIHLERKNYEKAFEHLSRAVELDPGYAEAYYVRGWAYLKLDTPLWALYDFLKVAEELNPEDVRLHAASYYGVGHVWLRAGVIENAINNFTKAIELKPDEALFYKMRGIAHRQMKNYYEALEDFDNAVKLNPWHCKDLKIERKFLREMLRLEEEQRGKRNP